MIHWWQRNINNSQGKQQDIQIDNCWVVLFLPLLSKTFKADINVEYCHWVAASENLEQLLLNVPILCLCQNTDLLTNSTILYLESIIKDIKTTVAKTTCSKLQTSICHRQPRRVFLLAVTISHCFWNNIIPTFSNCLGSLKHDTHSDYSRWFSPNTTDYEFNGCIKSPILWKDLKTFKLNSNMRGELQNDQYGEVFSKHLHDIGNSKI